GEYKRVKATLENAGIKVHGRKNDRHCVYFSDPDGHQLQLLMPNDESSACPSALPQATMTNGPFDFESFVQKAGDAIVAAGTDGSILLWNDAAERIFGYTEEEALGHSLDLIIPESLRARHWAGYRKVMGTGQTRYGTEVLRVPAVRKDGQRLSIAFTVTLFYSPGGETQAIVAIIRD